MIGLDIIFYTSWVYLSTLIAVELLIFDIPIKLNAHKKSKEAKTEIAVTYYINRKGFLLYKITPIFCLLNIMAIIANLVLHISDYWQSAILIIAFAIILMIIQTKKNIDVVNYLKKDKDINITDNIKNLNSIFYAHIITFLILTAIIFCYVFKF